MDRGALIGCVAAVFAAVAFLFVFLARKARAARSGNDSSDLRTSDMWFAGTTKNDPSGESGGGGD